MHIQVSFSSITAMSMALSRVIAIPALHKSVSRSGGLTVSQLETIAPTSNTCEGATYAFDCRTATQALPFILESFDTYSITSPGAQAAVISTIALESDDFKYKRPYVPSPNPGQGTRNMQSAAFNHQYALSLKLDSVTLLEPNQVLTRLLSNEAWDFGSAAWFLDTQCGPDVKTGLAAGGIDGFTAYLTCIGTTMTLDREAYWHRAIAAFGIQSSG